MNPMHYYHTPVKPISTRASCPVCHETVYSRAGIHPQCAVIQSDPPKLRSKKQQARALVDQANQATDQTGASGSASFTWDAYGTITIAAPAETTVAVGYPVSLQVQATDSVPGQTLTFHLVSSDAPGTLSVLNHSRNEFFPL